MSVVRYEAPANATSLGKIEEPQADQPNQQQQQSTQDQRPTWLPEKFKSPEDLSKAYAELEKKLSGKQPSGEAKPTPEGEKKPAEGEKPKDGEQPKKDTPAPENNEFFKPFFEEFSKDGKLSEESYKKLAEEHKIPRETVDDYIALRQAKVAQIEQTNEVETNKVLESVGGREKFDEMANWARESLEASEIAAFNKVLDTGDFAQIRLAVAGLHQKFTEANGRQGARFRGTGGNSGVTPFQNTAEVTKAMSDPRYQTDEAYRTEVADRLAQSKVF